MDLKKLILKRINQKKKITAAEIIKITGFSRVYVNRFIKELVDDGKIILIGKANQARYIKADKSLIAKAKKEITKIRKILQNKNLSEDVVLESIKEESGIFLDLSKNVSDILNYAFTEMLNNAIEHSKSKTIEVRFERDDKIIRFNVDDKGIGIFNNIIKKRKLKNELEAIQELLKGKQTTAPRQHTGEGIFFTSKIADAMIIQGSNKKLIFNNLIDDIFIKDIKLVKGTKVVFTISTKSKKKIDKIFKQFTGEIYDFSTTQVGINLYEVGADLISRSQAHRVLAGLDKFKIISLDFKKVESVGQGFADEVFRVWQIKHPDIKIEYKNANENINFMINRAKI